MTEARAAALRRVVDRVGGEGTLDALAERLSPADLATLLLEVVRRRSAGVSPAALLRRYRDDAFVEAAGPDGRALVRLAHLLVEALPEDVDVVGLSPLAPLGASSALAPVHQDRMVSTVRGTEVVSDPTNVLALEAAVRRSVLLRRDPRAVTEVRLAAVHRVLRGQRFPAGWQQHFTLLALVAAGRDGGNRRFERGCLAAEVATLVDAVLAVGVRRVEVRVTDLSGGAFDPVADVASAMAGRHRVSVVADPDRERARGYYQEACFLLHGGDGEELLELGDGGFVDWTAQLLSNSKERLFTGAISLDRLPAALALSPPLGTPSEGQDGAESARGPA